MTLAWCRDREGHQGRLDKGAGLELNLEGEGEGEVPRKEGEGHSKQTENRAKAILGRKN